MRICFYEDRRTALLSPLTLTRPASDLLCGLTSLGEKHIHYFAPPVVGYLCRPFLADWLRSRHPGTPVNDATWLRSAPTILVNTRWLVPPTPPRRTAPWLADGPFIGLAQGEIAFAVVDPPRLEAVSPSTIDDCLHDWAQTLPCREVGGVVVNHPWELIDHNSEQLEADFDAHWAGSETGYHPTGFGLVGPTDRLFIHPTARVDPFVVADTTAGPVVIGENAVVTAFTRLEGPCFIGSGSHLLSAKVRGGTSIGPHCRIGGEVEASIVLGYTNKYHDGFLGHSYVGEWVNLAAGTSTGDLRCDYGPIRVVVEGDEIATGRTKLGSLIGDHAKTGLGVLLNCGTSIGIFAQVLPSGQFAPRSIPSFHRVGPEGARELDVTRLLATAEVVMRRRGRELSAAQAAVYRFLARQAERVATPSRIPLRKSA
jgi:UDP-N-acetylglucosamine diphosphorylase/glucosamine-1-phosphate N-acetyltransferase